MLHHLGFRHATLGVVALGFVAACATTAATTTSLDPSSPPEVPPDDGPVGQSDAGAGERADARISKDASAPVDAALPIPACTPPFHRITTDDHGTRADAVIVPFTSDMALGAMFGSPANGGSVPRWFAFDLSTSQLVDLSFSGSKAEAAFYFESETASRFGLWFVSPKKSGVSLEPGRWFVKLADASPITTAVGSTVELDFKGSPASATCGGG